MLHVLLVEDSPTQRHYAQRVLSRCGATVMTARNGMQAVRKAREYQPDLIMMDVDMPLMNGFEACRILNRDKRTHEIPVLMLSACESNGCRLRAMMRGASDYLIKPLDEGQVQKVLGNVNKIARLA
jgi:twitching motility two-component system response regulator PilH